MDMLQPVSSVTARKCQEWILKAAEKVAEESMEKAVDELEETEWQRPSVMRWLLASPRICSQEWRDNLSICQ